MIKTNMTNLTPRRQVFKKEIQLLSHGFSAPDAWPDGKLTVYPWDSDINDFLLEQTKIGTPQESVLYSLVEKLADLRGASIDQFPVGEVNTVLLVARAIRHENKLQYRSKCPYCNTEENEEIQVPDELEKVGEKTADYSGFDTITLPVCKDVVQTRPLLVKDEKIIESRDTAARKNINDSTCRILLSVVSVGGGQPDVIEELHRWYMALHPEDAEFLERKEDELSPHLNTRIEHRCRKCKTQFFHNLRFDQDFFRSGSTDKS